MKELTAVFLREDLTLALASWTASFRCDNWSSQYERERTRESERTRI